ncbi:MAG: hypothetical protein WDN44_14490 [Sphingomonas sp.]
MKAVEILAPASREADATPKTRQNFALALALAGRWQEAKSVAAIDVPADQLDQRVMQWASFSRPTNAYDQVASLLGVHAIADAGQPAQLALVQPENVGVAGGTGRRAPWPRPRPRSTPICRPRLPLLPKRPLSPRPIRSRRSSPSRARSRAPARRSCSARAEGDRPGGRRIAAAAGKRLCRACFGGAERARQLRQGQLFRPDRRLCQPRDRARRLAAQRPARAAAQPAHADGARVSTKAGNFYRLSVGGFARGDADTLCRAVKTGGGTCFVRASAGDSLASWVRGGPQVASR